MSIDIQSYPGTPLSEDEILSGKVLTLYDELRGNYAWDAGIAIGKYLAALKEGIILGAYCATCRKTVVPPRIVCEWCFRPITTYVPLKDTGTVMTFSLCYVTWDVKRIETPEIPAVIEIDGASPLQGILHKISEIKPEDMKIGMRVQAVWKSAAERNGSITDILYFRPIGEQQ